MVVRLFVCLVVYSFGFVAVAVAVAAAAVVVVVVVDSASSSSAIQGRSYSSCPWWRYPQAC